MSRSCRTSQAAQPAFDPRCRKDRFRFLLAISGGHHTVPSLGELASDFADSPILLATRFDDIDRDVAGTQLIVPSDGSGARYISASTSIWTGACRPVAA